MVRFVVLTGFLIIFSTGQDLNLGPPKTFSSDVKSTDRIIKIELSAPLDGSKRWHRMHQPITMSWQALFHLGHRSWQLLPCMALQTLQNGLPKKYLHPITGHQIVARKKNLTPIFTRRLEPLSLSYWAIFCWPFHFLYPTF